VPVQLEQTLKKKFPGGTSKNIPKDVVFFVFTTLRLSVSYESAVMFSDDKVSKYCTDSLSMHSVCAEHDTPVQTAHTYHQFKQDK
jgi:hypothetical protein